MQPRPRERQRFGIIGNNAFSVVNFRLPLMCEIVRQGHQVFALAPDFDDDKRRTLRDEGITPVDIFLSRTGLNPVRDIRDMMALRARLGALKLDVALSFAIKPVIYGTLAAKLAGIPRRYALIAGLGYAFGDAQTLGRKALEQAARALYRLALSQADRVFMQNPDDVEDFVRMRIVPADKIVRVNGTGVDLVAWTKLPPIEDPLTFILVARLLREKGVEDFVAAARLIRQTAPTTRFVILGGLDSNPNSLSHAHVSNWVDEGIVEWPGHVDVLPYLRQSSVFVLPSYYREGVPKSILEALASGRPVITTDMPGCRETVVPGENGWLVRPRDPTGLAVAMQRFIDRPEFVTTMGERSRQLAEERFDIRDVNARMIAAMELTGANGP
jgi:glycosyltransferase involved in cell wall biosynthesis